MLLLPLAITAITLALILYTIGVWSEHFAHVLKLWHLLFFWGGLFFDASGTEMMRLLIRGPFAINLHSMTGIVALLLMAIHALWATIVLFRHEKRALAQFHRVSLTVWVFWLIPYGTGVVLNSGLLH